MFIRMEISPIGLTNIHSAANCLTLRYIDIIKIQKRNKSDEWVSLTASENECISEFKKLAIWKFQGEWEIADINCLINRNEYSADVISDIGKLVNKNCEADDGELILRKLEWDSKKKLIFQPHSLIVKNYCEERDAYLSGELLSTCWDCKVDAEFGKWHVMCIDGTYLNVNENNEITYNLIEENWKLKELVCDPRFHPKYKYKDQFIGSLIFKIRMDVWYAVTRSRSRHIVVGEGIPYISLHECCGVILKEKHVLEEKSDVVLSMDTICDHLYYLICILKEDADKNVYLNKKISVEKKMDIGMFTNTITYKCSQIL
eukprot:455924_1